jgi:hypothetical protein
MNLEARAENCCSSTFVLKVNGLPHGKFSGRWFSEGLDVQCIGRQRLQFQNVRWLGSEFVLLDLADGQLVGRAVRAGLLTSTWDLELRDGPARLVSAGLFDPGYRVERDGEPLARVDRVGVCERGWCVAADDALADTDLLLVGLLYHTLLERRRRQHAAHAGPHGT